MSLRPERETSIKNELPALVYSMVEYTQDINVTRIGDGSGVFRISE